MCLTSSSSRRSKVSDALSPHLLLKTTRHLPRGAASQKPWHHQCQKSSLLRHVLARQSTLLPVGCAKPLLERVASSGSNLASTPPNTVGNGGYLAGQWPSFWTSSYGADGEYRLGWTGYIRIDNVTYEWMGNGLVHLFAPVWPPHSSVQSTLLPVPCSPSRPIRSSSTSLSSLHHSR